MKIIMKILIVILMTNDNDNVWNNEMIIIIWIM